MVGGIAAAAPDGDADQELTGTTRDRAVAAALAATGGGTVLETEAGDDGAAYGVEIRLADGRQVEVNLDESFRVVGQEADEDKPGEDDGPMTHRRTAARLGIGLALRSRPPPAGRAAGPAEVRRTDLDHRRTAAACVKKEQGTGCLPLAPERRRVDLAAPVFSRPTEITNPLFPVAQVTGPPARHGRRQAVPGRGDPAARHQGHQLERAAGAEPASHQYVAYLGRAHPEVALDWYAQADDGSVWYFGEDVFNYEDGVVADTDGTWLAGKDGPAGDDHARQPRSPGTCTGPRTSPGSSSRR